MSNVNSEDTGGPAHEDGGTGGGASRVVEQRQEVRGRGGWGALGTLVAVVLLLAILVWPVAEFLRVSRVVDDPGIVWLYAALAVLILAGGAWALYRILRRGTGEQE